MGALLGIWLVHSGIVKSQASNRRTRKERERDLAKISEHYLRGYTQAQIGEILGFTQQQISLDLKEMQKRWKESALRNFDEAKAQELAKIDNLELEYWEAWHNSRGQKKVSSTERADTASGQRNKAQIRTEDMQSDPRFLEGVRWCVDRRCKLLGLDAPSKIAPTNPEGNKPYEPALSERVIARRVTALLERARARRTGAAVNSSPAGGEGSP